MKKNYRFLSSIALTGMLATSIMGTTVNAATPAKEVIGVCSNVISGKMVPVVVKNGADSVTMTDIKNSGKFDIVSVVDANAPLKSGDKFKVKDGTEYTVVVYGDANKDGYVDAFDALYIQENAFNEFTGVDKVSADVVRKDNSGVDTFDALRIQEYAGGAQTAVTVEPHTPDTDPVVTDSNYTIKVNENGYINNQNDEDVEVEIKLAKAYDKEKELKIVVKDKDGKEVTAQKKTITIPANTVAYTYKKDDNATPAVSALNLSTVDDGEVTIELIENIDGKDTVVGTIKTTKNTVEPVAAKVSTSRPSTKSAALSLENGSENSDIVKVYYKVLAANDKTATETIANIKDSVAVSGNKLTNAVVSNNLSNEDYYRLAYVLENSYGSKSDVLYTTIAKDVEGTEQEKEAKSIKVPDLATTQDFTWTGEANKTYVVTLYRGATVVGEAEVESNASTACTTAGATLADGTTTLASKMNKAGKYRIEIVTKGDEEGATKASNVVSSSEVEVKQLNEVTGIAFSINEDGDRVLSWKDDVNEKDNVANYTIQLLRLNKDGKYEAKAKDGSAIAPYTATATEIEKKEIVLDNTTVAVEDNEVYKAEIVANAQNGQYAIVDSEKAISDGFYAIVSNTFTVTDVTENSETLNLKDITVNGKNPAYKVEIYKIVKEDDTVLGSATKSVYVETRNVQLVDKKIELNGLEANTLYAIKLIAEVDNVKGETAYIPINRTSPVIKTLKKVSKVDEAKNVAGTIYYKNLENANVAYIDGKEINKNDGYATTFTDMFDVIEALHANDVISITGKTVEVTMASGASSTTDALDFAATTKGMTLVVTGNDRQRAIKTSATEAEQPEKVTLQGTNAMFGTKDLNAKEIVLNNGVEVVITDTTSKTYTVTAGATVIINGVEVKADKETKIKASGKNIEVQVDKGTTNNNITFKNLNTREYANKEAEIKFVGTDANPSSYAGTIRIESVGGKVTVKQTNMNVADIKLDVVVEDAKVVMTDAFPSDNKTINVTVTEDIATGSTAANTIIDAIAKTKVPTGLNDGDVIELKDYTLEEITTEILSDTIANDELTDAQVEAATKVKEFIDSFGINNKGVKLTITTAATKTIKFTFTKKVSGIVIVGIE